MNRFLAKCSSLSADISHHRERDLKQRTITSLRFSDSYKDGADYSTSSVSVLAFGWMEKRITKPMTLYTHGGHGAYIQPDELCHGLI